jgi:exonuclease SbcD
MRSIKFLQFSDVHLDSRLSSTRLNLPQDKQDIRRSELKDIVRKASDLALDNRVDVVLIPGDLWDDESISIDTTLFTFEQFKRIAPVPIVITPGNHDFYSPSSNYNRDFLKQHKIEVPPNVYIFQEMAFQSLRLPSLPEVNFVGISFSQNVEVKERLLRQPIQKQSNILNILVFHGSLEAPFLNAVIPPDKKRTLPFSREDLLQNGFDYAAIGHYHTFIEIRDENGSIRGAYAGCPAGRSIDEAGERYVLLGEIEKGGVRTLEKIRLDERQVQVVEVKLEQLVSSDRLKDKIQDALRQSGANQQDIIYVRLNGIYPKGERVRLPDDFLKDKFFHIQIDDSDLRPDYDVQALLSDPNARKKTEGRFVEAMITKLEEVKKEGNPEEERRVLAALYYGLDAIFQKEVTPRYED